MSKMDDAQEKAKKILDEMDETAAQTEVTTDAQSQSTVTTGSVPYDIDGDQASLIADLQRLQAEFANYKRRAETERAEVIDFATSRVVREFLTVRDSFDQELAHRPANIDATWAASINAIRAQFDKVLSGLGVARFESKGQPFDPHLHEAIASDGDGNIVTEELAPGYKLGTTTLRHAMVKVGSGEQPVAESDVAQLN